MLRGLAFHGYVVSQPIRGMFPVFAFGYNELSHYRVSRHLLEYFDNFLYYYILLTPQGVSRQLIVYSILQVPVRTSLLALL